MLTNRLILSVLALFGALLFPSSIGAQSMTTDPVGFTSISLPANSDTLINPPFTRPVAYVGAITSAADSTITVSGSPWSANQFVYMQSVQRNHYYALIGPASTTNPKEGHIYTVVSNSMNSLTVDTSQDNLVGIPANAQLLVIPNWTPATIFPASDANISFTPTTSSASYKTQLLIPDYAAPGINQGYATTYFFSSNVDGTVNNIGWRIVGDNTTSHDDDPLLPDGYMAVRNQNGAPALSLTALGSVLTKKLAVALDTSAASPSVLGQQQDNAVSMVRPIDVTLNNTGLTPDDGSFVATRPSTSNHLISGGDHLLVFSNSNVGFNKPPSAIYYYTTPGGWRSTKDPLNDHGNDIIPAGSALIVRKAPTTTGQSVYWTNSPTY